MDSSFDATAAPTRPIETRWELRRNRSLTPRQTLACFAALCAFNGVVAVVFWLLGYAWVSFFAALETAGVAAALLSFARHACDAESLSLVDGRLTVRKRSGPTL